jgi:cold shock CspA family protein
MTTGRLKTWFAARGFGFIEDAAGGPDIFVHANALRLGIDPDDLETSDHLVFEISERPRSRPAAVNVRRVE